MEKFLLIAHLLGAGYVGVYIISALISLVQNKISSFKSLSTNIAVGGTFQLITGSALALAEVQTLQSFFQFCNKIGLYLAVILTTEIILFYRMKKYTNRIVFAPAAIVSLIFGILFTSLTLVNIYVRI